MNDAQLGSMSLALEHLERLREDARDEIKRRIEQRDAYSTRLAISLTALLAVAFATEGYRRVILAAPLVTIYFTVLIVYSYKIHAVLARYLREELEPAIAALAGTDPKLEWECFYSLHAVPGIRKGFFMASLWVVLALTMLLLFATETELGFRPILVVTGLTYGIACLAITIYFVWIGDA